MKNKGDTGQKSGKRAICETGRLFGSYVCLLVDLSLLSKGEHSKLPLAPVSLGCSYLLCWCLLFGRLVVPDSVTPWTAAHQVSLSFTISRSLLKLMSTESVMPSNHLILCSPLLLLPSVFPSIRVFSNELTLRIR